MGFEKEISNKQFIKFISEVAKLNEYEYFGLLKVLSVPAVADDGHKRPFDNTFEEVLDRFIELNHTRRKNLMKILKKSQHRKIDFERIAQAANKLREATENGTEDSKA